jgi:hypothetical protein
VEFERRDDANVVRKARTATARRYRTYFPTVELVAPDA